MKESVQRESGYYWVRKLDYWQIVFCDSRYREYKWELQNNHWVDDSHWEEIDETRIERSQTQGLELKEDFCDDCKQRQNFLNGFCEVCGSPDMANSFELAPVPTQGAGDEIKRPENIVEIGRYKEPHCFESDLEGELFYSYLEVWEYVKKLESHPTASPVTEDVRAAIERLKQCQIYYEGLNVTESILSDFAQSQQTK